MTTKKNMSSSSSLIKIEEISEKFFMSVQKALSMSKMGLEIEESFSEARSLLDEIIKMYEDEEEKTTKDVILMNIFELMEDLEERLEQI